MRLARLALPFLVSLSIAAALASFDAHASVSYDSPYTFEQTYGSAMRLIRVDFNLKVTEKDPELGYVMFEYKSPESGSRITNGWATAVLRSAFTRLRSTL